MADVLKLKPINIATASVTLEGTTPLIQHAFSTKALEMMREKHAGKKTKNREVRDPHQEFLDCMYRTKDGGYGIPSPNIKSCLVTAAHKDLGIEKTLIRKGIFVHRMPDGDMILPMRCSDPWMREDFVRVGAGSTDLRYRPQWDEWEVDVHFEWDTDLLDIHVICSLFDRAGFGVGLHEWRPEKDGENGRFKVKRVIS